MNFQFRFCKVNLVSLEIKHLANTHVCMYLKRIIASTWYYKYLENIAIYNKTEKKENV